MRTLSLLLCLLCVACSLPQPVPFVGNLADKDFTPAHYDSGWTTTMDTEGDIHIVPYNEYVPARYYLYVDVAGTMYTTAVRSGLYEESHIGDVVQGMQSKFTGLHITRVGKKVVLEEGQ